MMPAPIQSIRLSIAVAFGNSDGKTIAPVTAQTAAIPARKKNWDCQP